MARYMDIKTFDDENTDDYAIGIWFAGCEHHCPGCQNPSTWDKDNGIAFDQNTIEYILTELELNKNYYGNVFLTGGDPLAPYNISEAEKLCKAVKNKYGTLFKIWLWTGYAYEQVKEKSIMQYIDILVDGPYIEKLKDTSLMYRGSSNQRVIELNN